MKKILVSMLIIAITPNASFCFKAKSNFMGVDKIKKTIQEKKNNSIKIDKNTFKQYVEQARKEEINKPSSKLASVINASKGSTIKGLPEYTSKKEKEAIEQIKYSKILENQFINWANQFELVKKLKTNKSDGLVILKNKITEFYKNKKNIFTKFIQDLGIESYNLEEQISVLSSIYKSFEVRSNNKIANDIEKILHKLLEMQKNIGDLIGQAEELVNISLSSLTREPILHEVRISPNYHFRTKTR